jgi:hypothetical protein
MPPNWDFPYFLMTMAAVRNFGELFCRKCLNWDFLDVFYIIRLGLLGLGRKTPSKVSLSPYIKHPCVIWFIASGIHLDLQDEVVFVRFLYSKVTHLPTLFILYYSEGSHCVQPLFLGWRIIL